MCCNNDLEQTLTLLHSEWSKEIEPSGQSSTHHALIVSNPIDKKGSEFMRRSLQSGRGDSFIRTGSAWLKDLAVDNTRNWSRISPDTIRNALAFSFDDTTNYGHCIHVLCLLCSEEKTNRIIREDNGIVEISDYLPTQFPIEREKIDLSHTFTLHNTNLRFTLRTLRYLTEPEDDYPLTRTNRSPNLKKVFDTLQAWMSDETSRGLTLQVLYNLIRGMDTTRAHSPTDPD